MKINPLLYCNCKNRKQRKQHDIRVKNYLLKGYNELKSRGEILDFRVKSKHVKGIQSVGVWIIPNILVKEITVDIGFTKSSP